MAERGAASLSKADVAGAIEEATAAATEIKHLLRLLIGDLEFGLSENRAVARHGDTLTLNFNADALEATNWLAGEAWSRTSILADKLLTLTNELV